MVKLFKWWIYRIAVYRTLRKFYKMEILVSCTMSGMFYEQFSDNYLLGPDPEEDTHEEMLYYSE
jgi:hypothetical protein